MTRLRLPLLLRALGCGAVLAALLLGAVACSHPHFIPQTHILQTGTNQDILDVCEEYRSAVERRDAPAVLALLDPGYRSRAVTPIGDDVGYERFRDVTLRRLADLKVVSFNVQYRTITVASDGMHATVQVYEDASFELRQDTDEHWHRFADYGELTLKKSAGRWLFTSGL